MVPQDAVSWDFDVIMSALRDPAQRLPLLKEVEKWSSENVDAILVLAKQGRIETAWTQMADALNQIARDKFWRTTSAVPLEIEEATTRRRDALRQRQNQSRSAGGDVFDEFKAGFGQPGLRCID